MTDVLVRRPYDRPDGVIVPCAAHAGRAALRRNRVVGVGTGPRTNAMNLHRPLHACAYVFGVFPVTARAAERRGDRPRYRLHWPALALKAVHMTFYGLLSAIVFMVTTGDVKDYRKLVKKMLTTRMLDMEMLFVYQSVAGIVSNVVCQSHALWPPVVRALDECFLGLCRADRAAGAWQTFAAYSSVVLVAFEVAMYVYMIFYRSVSRAPVTRSGGTGCRARPSAAGRTKGVRVCDNGCEYENGVILMQKQHAAP